MTDNSAETERLLQAIRSGDRPALDRLLARHSPALYDFVRMRLDGRLRPRLDVSDVVQETQAEVCQRLQDYLERQPMPFRAWLLRTAYERLLKLRRMHLQSGRRSVHREAVIPDRSSLVLARQLFSQSPSPSEMMASDERVARLRAGLARLSEKDREVIIMRDLEGLSNQEIGFLLDLEPSVVSRRHGRALLRLHKLLSESEGKS